MKQIKAENPDLVTCPVVEMKLFLLHKRDDLPPASSPYSDDELEEEYRIDQSDEYDPDVYGAYRA